jgi:hypothetical protein
VTITLGGFAIELREPLDAPWRSLATNPGNHRTAAHPTGPWVFRGYSPGRHVHAMSLRDRLRRRLVSTRAARLGTLYELTEPAPAASIAEAPGYSPAAIERHAKESGAQYARYVAAVIDAGPSAAQQAPAHAGGPARQANEQTPGCRGYPGADPAHERCSKESKSLLHRHRASRTQAPGWEVARLMGMFLTRLTVSARVSVRCRRRPRGARR